MEYAAIWVTRHRIMILDASREAEDLENAIDELMPAVRGETVPDHALRDL